MLLKQLRYKYVLMYNSIICHTYWCQNYRSNQPELEKFKKDEEINN